MAKLTFKTDNCKGCGLCVDVCPKKVLRLATDKINKKGHHPVEAEPNRRSNRRLPKRRKSTPFSFSMKSTECFRAANAQSATGR